MQIWEIISTLIELDKLQKYIEAMDEGALKKSFPEPLITLQYATSLYNV